MQTYDVNYFNLANNMLKVFLKLVVVDLYIIYHLKPLHV
jgi:hypothetical protein